MARLKKIKQILIKSLIYFFLGSLGLVLIYRFLPVPITPLMVLRSIESLGQNKLIGISKNWVNLSEISHHVPRAVLKAEDALFYEHNGFDFEAIQKAMKYNETHKKKKGASTISQQTAKNVFLWPHRDWIRKGFEVYFTILIEVFWPKERILEVYLNVIELGPGVYGVEAAAQKYFRKNAKSLNSSQASLIAAVLPNPRRFKISNPSNYILNRQSNILNRPAPVTPRKSSSQTSFFIDLLTLDKLK